MVLSLTETTSLRCGFKSKSKFLQYEEALTGKIRSQYKYTAMEKAAQENNKGQQTASVEVTT